MRTTLDLPDDLFRRLKAHAALQGKTLREIFLDLTQRELQSALRTQPRTATQQSSHDFVD